ncbi:CheR family methyltransferase [Microbulbifer litoralis]|uniref:CheR family methyltransferase n=1 Tax=Microbulbifer litoralis TaxID=2933965 RepID=UPI002028A375|nr:CheR family methyltransferase [Microbulbifer sp. GX H0434]
MNAGVSAAAGGGAPAPGRDLLFTETDFARIRELIGRRAGIVLAEHKRDMVYTRIGRRLRQCGLNRFSDYLALLERESGGAEWQEFTNALTTNLTAFFRELHHFPLLVEHLRGRRRPLTVWSAGASTGEEPYSIAMALLEALGDGADLEVRATDIDTGALERARSGIYPLDQVRRQVDEQRIKRFFLRGGGRHTGFARIRPEVAARVRFESLNLIAPQWPAAGTFDAIFCRNVMIYFDHATQAQILQRFAPLLKRDGLLFVGHSESLSHISDRFLLRGQTVYTRTGG